MTAPLPTLYGTPAATVNGVTAPTMMELACRDALTRDIPAHERAFIQALVDQAERDRAGKGWA